MEYQQIYITQDENVGGLRYTAGNIYLVEKHIADQLIGEGKARVAEYVSLNSHKQEVNKAISELEEEVQRISKNQRLAPEAKKDDILQLVKEYDERINSIQDQYMKDIDTLYRAAQEKAITINIDDKFNADKARQEAGIIRSEIEMIPSLLVAAETIQSKLEFIDRGTARELLSQFIDVKRALEEKGKNGQISDSLVRITIQNIYNGLKKVADDPVQVKATEEAAMIKAIKKYEGDITKPYRTLVNKKYSSRDNIRV